MKVLDERLIEAVKSSNCFEIEKLIVSGVDPNMRDSEEDLTALMQAARWSCTKSFKTLIKAGADVNIQNERGGWTALMLVSRYGSLEMLESLLDVGVENINAKNKEGWTAFHLATIRLANNAGDLKMLYALADAGADPTIPHEQYGTLLELAEKNNTPDIADIVRKIIQKREDPEHQLYLLSQWPYKKLVNPSQNREIFKTLLKLDCLARVFETEVIDNYDKLTAVYKEVMLYAQDNPKLKRQIQNAFIKKRSYLAS